MSFVVEDIQLPIPLGKKKTASRSPSHRCWGRALWLGSRQVRILGCPSLPAWQPPISVPRWECRVVVGDLPT